LHEIADDIVGDRVHEEFAGDHEKSKGSGINS
jgi:hypothetical protein